MKFLQSLLSFPLHLARWQVHRLCWAWSRKCKSLAKAWLELRFWSSILLLESFSFRLLKTFARESTLPNGGSMLCFLMAFEI